ncbi:MAG: response regulator, partial [Saprospiraceae bacterium]|nr:response regulator [Saprospiraceae bacterium]
MRLADADRGSGHPANPAPQESIMVNEIEATLIHLRAEFIAQMPTRIHTLEKHLEKLRCGEKEAACKLHHTAHSLAGAAGIHRLTDISDAARKMENLAASLPPEGKVNAPTLFALQKALARVGAAAANPSALPPANRSSMRVFVVDSEVDQTIWLRSTLEETGYQVEIFNQLSDYHEACEHGDKPAVVIMEMAFPEGSNAGAECLAELKTQHFAGVPVIFLSARQDIEAKLAAYRAGATLYLDKPVERDVLLRAISGLAGFAPKRPYRVLVVDDEPDQLAAHALI